MSSFTFADNKLGGRFTAAADAIAAGKLRTAAGIFLELGNELNAEAESTDGLMAEENEPVEWPVKTPPSQIERQSLERAHSPQEAVQILTDLQSCARGAHNFGPADPVSGWRTCKSCGQVNVAPPDGNGSIYLGGQELGDV